ncbi:hypothetical protein D3C84_1029670 [compost metagenome]
MYMLPIPSNVRAKSRGRENRLHCKLMAIRRSKLATHLISQANPDSVSSPLAPSAGVTSNSSGDSPPSISQFNLISSPTNTHAALGLSCSWWTLPSVNNRKPLVMSTGWPSNKISNCCQGSVGIVRTLNRCSPTARL